LSTVWSGSALEEYGIWIVDWDTLLAVKRVGGTIGILSLDELEDVEEMDLRDWTEGVMDIRDVLGRTQRITL